MTNSWTGFKSRITKKGSPLLKWFILQLLIKVNCCCILWPVFGCCTLQMLVEIVRYCLLSFRWVDKLQAQIFVSTRVWELTKQLWFFLIFSVFASTSREKVIKKMKKQIVISVGECSTQKLVEIYNSQFKTFTKCPLNSALNLKQKIEVLNFRRRKRRGLFMTCFYFILYLPSCELK